jgi:hypothetical protein
MVLEFFFSAPYFYLTASHGKDGKSLQRWKDSHFANLLIDQSNGFSQQSLLGATKDMHWRESSSSLDTTEN